MKNSRLLCIALFILLPLLAFATDARLVSDTHVCANARNTSFSAAVSLNVNSNCATLLQFDLSTLPAGTTGDNIARANLILYSTKLTGTGTFQVLPVLSGWNDLVYFTSAPTYGTPIARSVTVEAPASFVVIDVTAAVKDWASGGHNYGFVLRAADASTAVSFASKEAVDAQAPRLDITLATTSTPGPAGPQGPRGETGFTGPTGATGPAGPAGANGVGAPNHSGMGTLIVGAGSSCNDYPVNLPGVSAGDVVAIGLAPELTAAPGLQYSGFAVADDVVMIRACGVRNASVTGDVRIETWEKRHTTAVQQYGSISTDIVDRLGMTWAAIGGYSYKPFKITNNSPIPLTLTASFTDPAFTVQSDGTTTGCPVSGNTITLAAGPSTCTVRGYFRPVVVGYASGTMTLSGNIYPAYSVEVLANSPAEGTLTGFSTIDPVVPWATDFHAVLTLMNGGNTTIHIASATITNPDGALRTLQYSTDCPTTLAPAQQCTYVFDSSIDYYLFAQRGYTEVSAKFVTDAGLAPIRTFSIKAPYPTQ